MIFVPLLQLVTINGAKISREKKDIPIPQGIAHAVDKVMFPLPVGNILQTLKSDRERRFTRFLKAIQTSGLSETFAGEYISARLFFGTISLMPVRKRLTNRHMRAVQYVHH